MSSALTLLFNWFHDLVFLVYVGLMTSHCQNFSYSDEFGFGGTFCVKFLASWWARTIPDPTLSGTGEKWQTKVTKWLIDSAYRIWAQSNAEQYTPNQTDVLGAQLLETQAQLRKVYALAENNLTIHDRHELIKETLEERLTLPEQTNRLWATQLLRLIYIRLKHNSTRPHLTDIRQFFPPIQTWTN